MRRTLPNVLSQLINRGFSRLTKPWSQMWSRTAEIISDTKIGPLAIPVASRTNTSRRLLGLNRRLEFRSRPITISLDCEGEHIPRVAVAPGPHNRAAADTLTGGWRISPIWPSGGATCGAAIVLGRLGTGFHSAGTSQLDPLQMRDTNVARKVGSIFSRLTETQFLTRAIVDHYLAHDGHHLDGHDPAGHDRQGGGRHHDVYRCTLLCTTVHHRALPCATSRMWILGGQFKGDARIREGPEHSLRQGRGKKVG